MTSYLWQQVKLQSNTINNNLYSKCLWNSQNKSQIINGMLYIDYPFWLYNNVASDYFSIINLLNNQETVFLNQLPYPINYLRPIYCILRSTLEKHADILNYLCWGDAYIGLLEHLNDLSAYLMNKKNSTKPQLDSKIQDQLKLGPNRAVTSSTRFFLLNRFNDIYYSQYHNIVDFNKKCSTLYSSFSQQLHNNRDTTNPSVNHFGRILSCLCQIVYSTSIALQIHQTQASQGIPSNSNDPLPSIISVFSILPMNSIQLL